MSRITNAAAHFLGYSYASKGVGNVFPVVRGCLPPSLLWTPGRARLIDCSTFITALAVYVAKGVEWDAEAYADMQISHGDPSRLWSPVDAWERHGLGTRVDGPVDGWGLYQSWVDAKATDEDGDPISGGHQWAFNGRLGLRLHSTSLGGRGPTMDRGVNWADLEAYYDDGIQGVELK